MLKSPSLEVNLRRLKIWASANIHLGSNLREIILIEEDSLPADEFLLKMRIWLKLAQIEESSKRRAT